MAAQSDPPPGLPDADADQVRELLARIDRLEAEVSRLNDLNRRSHFAFHRDGMASAAAPGPRLVTFDGEPQDDLPPDAPSEDELARRIEVVRALSNADVETMGFERLTAEIHAILGDPVFTAWPVERQVPMIDRVLAIYTGYWHASGHSLVPVLEDLFRRAVMMPNTGLDILCLFYQLLYFLYFYVAERPSETRGFADNVVVPFAAAIRGAAASGSPATLAPPIGREPWRVGYLSQFAHGPRDSVGQFAHHLLRGLAQHFSDRYQPVLYAWSEWSEEALAQFASDGIPVRRFAAATMTERIQAVAQAIAEDRIDILISDQNAWLPTVLYERRAAPVQIYYMVGGLPFWPLANIDAIFRVDVYDPRLDGADPAKCFPMGLGPWDLQALAPEIDAARLAAERARFPANARLIGNYGRLTKITPDFLSIMAELAARHPEVVVVLGGSGDGGWIRDFIAAHGLAGRLELVEAYVDGHAWGHMLEVFLDSFPVEGGVSRREVMAKGQPVVTMRGPWAEVEGVPPLVVRDRRAYLDTVSRLLTDREFYENACTATREFVMCGMTEHDYALAVDEALTTIIERHPEGKRLPRPAQPLI